MPRALRALFNTHRPARCFSLCLSFEFSVSISFLLPSLLLSFSLCLFPPPPPPPPPLPAVFAGSFSARHPEAAVAPASLPTSVFVVGDDMSKLWRAGEGRERGREREGREGAHHSAWRKKQRDPERMSCGLQSAQIFSFSLFLSPAVYVGRQEWRQEAATPPSSPPSLPPSFLPSSSPTLLQLFTHSVTRLPTPLLHCPSFPLPHLPSIHSCSFFFPPIFICCVLVLFSPTSSLPRFVPLPNPPTGVPMHHKSHRCWSVLRCVQV